MDVTRVEVRTTCPRDCYDACGIVVVKVDGKRPRVRGDRSHPVSRGQLCQKCSIAYNGVFLDPQARITTPLRRSGAKGAGQFTPISWDDALGEIASRLHQIVETSGPSTVLNAHYTGTYGMLGYFFPLRFFHRLGATEVNPDTICNNAGHVALSYLYGTSLDGFDPRSAADASTILVWGANPSASAPHQHQHWLPEAPGAVIVVDPLRTETAKAADLHLQPLPGTDSALAFALAHVLDRDGLFDRAFIAEHTVGYSELEAGIHAASPEWAENVTGVPAASIERAAHLYGAGPSLLWIGQGLQRQPSGGNVVRSVAMLPALTGHLGRPGGGFLYLNGIETRGLDGDYLSGRALARGEPPTISHMDLVDSLSDTARSRALFCWNINIAASNPQQRQLRRALARDDLFTVVSDLFATDTTDYADIVLPAASFLEYDDLVVSYFHHSIAPQVQAVDPPGDALANSEIFRRLAGAMGYHDDALFESDRSVIARLLHDSGLGIDFATLAERGAQWPAEARQQFPDLHFATESGRIELASAAAARHGSGRVPLAHADAVPAPGRLRLLSPSSPWMLNTLYSNEPKIAARAGALSVRLHPDDARARGLAAGMLARVISDAGELVLPVALSEDVPPSVAVIPKGRWPKLEASGANVNVLNPGMKSDMGESSSVHGIEVTVVAAAGQS